MSLKRIQTFKIAGCKTLFNNIVDITRRMYAASRPKEVPLTGSPFVEQRRRSNTSLAHLTARSPHALSQSIADGRTQQEERPLPQHEPGLFSLMPPLRSTNPNSLMFQKAILNRERRPFCLHEDPPVKNVTSVEVKGSEMQKKLLDLLDQQKKLDKWRQDCFDRRSDRSRVRLNQETSRRISRNLEERVAAKDLGKWEAQDLFRPSALDSATFLVATRQVDKSPRYPWWHGRMTTYGSYNPDEELGHEQTMPSPDYTSSFQNPGNQGIMNTMRPVYPGAFQPTESINVVPSQETQRVSALSKLDRAREASDLARKSRMPQWMARKRC
ncbi:uncharacterized protein [Drosophila kikkawai]|uniref:Uncharacterized protein LOC108080043 n=1 Tax=Drosophila kikkawai TaxID=30033 RepID=A0A6P4INR8_DROKI|nr:uncharacterized protein LOC108080043 [Drosophila kikkawai]XP_017030111.1 uncharacterized protein LOC108080043 [Drosophila kikkawai]